jgi:hypothetical protein
MADTLLSTLTKLIAGIRLLLNEKVEGFWLDTDITLKIQEAQEEIAHETFCLRTWKTYTILSADIFADTVAGTAGVGREIRMDDDFIAIDEGLVYYNGVALRPTTQARLVLADSEWRDQTGTPSRYYVRGDMLGFDRLISVGDTVEFYQIERAVALSGDIAPFNGDYRLINFRKLIVDYVVSQCWYMKKDNTDGDRFWNKYLYGLNSMKELLGIDMDNSYQMIPEDHPARFYPREHFPDWGQS